MCLIILLLLTSASISRGDIEVTSLSKATNHFALTLLQKLHEQHSNEFFSSFSISSALAMLYNGAKGKTKKEMRNVLGYDHASIEDQQVNQQFEQVLDNIGQHDSKAYELKFANRIVAQKDSEILQSFEESMKSHFKSSVELIDFNEDPEGVMKDINEWAAKQTNDKIKQIIDEPLDPMTRMVILSAVYFKGRVVNINTV